MANDTSAKPAPDLRTQLSSGYWNRVARTAATNRAAKPDNTALDARARATDELLAPPGPRESAPAEAAYRRGGKIGGGHTTHNYCAGGKVISTRKM